MNDERTTSLIAWEWLTSEVNLEIGILGFQSNNLCDLGSLCTGDSQGAVGSNGSKRELKESQ